MVPGKDVPKKIHNVQPVYPPDAKELGIEGTVVIEATVDASGTVTNARPVSSPHASLTTAALEAVRQWRFEPPARAPVSFTVTVRFRLDEQRQAVDRFNAPAEYPAAARESGVAGAVLLEVTTDAAGTPTRVRAVRGEPVLVQAATDAVRKWTIEAAEDTPLLVGVNVVPRDVERADARPLRVGGAISPPTKIKDVRPVYPPEAKDAGLQGVVILQATIGTDGTVLHGRVLHSVPGLDAAALESVLQWEFTPVLMNGKPVPVIMTVTVNFTLQ
jgi:TonB family protein